MTGGRPLYSVAAWMTPHNSALEDIAQVARTGGQGIGLWEGKFGDGDDGAIREALEAHQLRATLCMPREWTILAGPLVKPGVTRDPRERTELICESIPRLAAFDPVTIVVGPGTSGDPANPSGPLDAVAEGLAMIADVAAEHGTRIGFELLAQRRGSPLPDLPSIATFIDEVGRSNVGILFDVWHSWCEPDLDARLLEYAARIDGVHVNDVRFEERTFADRLLPGDGRDVAADIIATLIRAGYDGWYELEVISDDGTYGLALPDSLWNIPHEELLERGREAFDRVYTRAVDIAAAGR